jgi:hypothetical protein
MRVRKGYRGRVVDVQVLPLRDRGYTAHFSIEDHQGIDVVETCFQTGQRFTTEDDALQAALWWGVNKIETGYDPNFNPYEMRGE